MHDHLTRARRSALCATAALLAVAADLQAQCPNGTPPPCKPSASANAATLRANPALNARSWIVVPFTNATRSTDLDWLRDASVNLLTLDLGRWTDIHVVDDKRVGDLLRELPASRASQPLTLNDGLSIARRAGAGKLVMGDYFKVGKGARIVVNVFDVQRGSRIRSFTQQAPEQDSVLSAFGPIARGVLALPAPTDAKLGATGTSRADAYQEYLLGSSALNRFEVTEARTHLERAIALDSGFALAHYKLAVAMHWNDGDTSEATHARAAARLSATLPPRERALINARVAFVNGDYERACTAARALVAKDSTDVEALYTIGECEYHGGLVYGMPVDSAHGTFRGNWNTAIASLRRVLALDPTYHPAFQHILSALSQTVVSACVRPSPRCANDPTTWASPIVRDGDSLLIQVVHPGTTDYVALTRRATANRTPYLNFQAARKIAEDWVEASQRGPRALLNLGQVNVSLGELEPADDALRQIRPDADVDTRRSSLYWLLQIAAQRADGARGRPLLDSLRRMIVTPYDSALYASYAAVFGKLQPALAVIRRTAAVERWSPEQLRYTLHVPRIVLGVPSPDVADDERRYWNSLSGDSLCAAGLTSCRTTVLLPSLAYALRIKRAWWPSFKVQPIGFRFFAAVALASGNREYITLNLAYLDSLSRARLYMLGDEASTTIIAADLAMASGDSLGALARLRFAGDAILPFLYNSALSASTGGLVMKAMAAPRIMLQRADLAAALGYPQEARTWYMHVLDLWSDADPELQPTVTRIRAALAGVPDRR